MLCERWRTVGPPASAFRGWASNRPVLRWLKTVVVSDRGKVRRDRIRWGPRRRSRAPGGTLGVAVEALLITNWRQNRGPDPAPVMGLAVTRATGQVASGAEAA